MATKLAFTTLREDQGRPLFWPSHWQRLVRSWDYFKGNQLLGESELYADLVKHWSNSGDKVVRVDLLDDGTFELTSRALTCRDDEPLLRLGLCQEKLSKRDYPDWLKAGDYSIRLQLREEFRKQKFDEVLYLDEYDNVAEASVSNIIWSKGNKFFTPIKSQYILQGIATSLLTTKFFDQFECDSYDLNHLLNADAAWLINAVTGPQRIGSIDGTSFSTSVPESDLDQLYWELVKIDRGNR